MAQHSRSNSSSGRGFSGGSDFGPGSSDAHSDSGGNIQQSWTSSPESVADTEASPKVGTSYRPTDAPEPQVPEAPAPASAPVEIAGRRKKRKINRIGSQASVNHEAKCTTPLLAHRSPSDYQAELDFLRLKVKILEDAHKECHEEIPRLVQQAMAPALKVVGDFLQSLGSKEQAMKLFEEMLQSLRSAPRLTPYQGPVDDKPHDP